MQPRKLNIAFASFPYGGNGGISSEIPAIRHWMVRTCLKLDKDPRIDAIDLFDVSDTPITMTRNQAVYKAQQLKADVLVMVDSDQHADSDPGRLGAKPFIESSFSFLYDHWEKGPVMIGAPYCGPPPARNVYVFEWATTEHSPQDANDTNFKLEAYSRERANGLAGIQECGALPTGLIMFDMRLFDILEPPFFSYEYEGDGPACAHCGVRKPGKQAFKCSTEDVVMTRDVSLQACIELGYNATFCNWDAWAGHAKSELVGAPVLFTTDMVAKRFRNAVLRNQRSDEQEIMVPPQRIPPTWNFPRRVKTNGQVQHDEVLSGLPKD